MLCSLQVAAEIVERKAETFHVALKILSHPRRQKLLHLGSCYGAPSAASWFFKAQLRWHLSCQDTLPLRQVLQFFFLVVMVDLHFSPFPVSSWNTSDLHFQDIQRSQRPDLIHGQEDTSWSTPGSSSIHVLNSRRAPRMDMCKHVRKPFLSCRCSFHGIHVHIS